MNPNKALLITLLLAISAFAFGYRSYTQAEQRIAADLSQALQQTVIARCPINAASPANEELSISKLVIR